MLFGELRTGRITDTLDVTGCLWSQENNDAGAISNVTVPMREVRAKDLRQAAPAARTYLAVDVDGELQEAGPIWSRVRGEDDVTLGAAGLWSLFDHRKVIPVLAAGQRVQDATTTVSGTNLGGIARALVAQAMTHAGGDLPLVLPPALAGDRTETFHGWELSWVGDELRQLTQREAFAPDLRFRPRYTADRMGIEWVMEAGTEDAPLLTQTGEDWYFDASVPQSTVVNIQTDEDATAMGMQAWVTGNGMEQDILIAEAYDPSLIDAGWPRLEVESGSEHSNVTDVLTLLGHAINLRDRSARPVEVWKVRVQASAAAQVLAGHYAHVTAHPDDAWLKGEQAFMRVKSKSGDLGETITLDMYSVAGRI